MKIKFNTYCIIMLFFTINSCKDKPVADNAGPTGTLKVTFNNTVSGSPLVIDAKSYTNPFGENYVVKKFKYYISSVKINNIDKAAEEKESYHLIDEANEASKTFTYNAAPESYNTITFTIGVDSLRNVSGAQTGALDPLNDMFWTWNSGYIMAKLEATSPSSTQVNNKVEYHTGGFTGVNNVLKKVTLVLRSGAYLDIRENKISEIIIEANLNEWWQNPNDIKITDNPICTTPGALAKKIADNYSKMFTVKNVINY